MEKKKRVCVKMICGSSIAVALFTALFIIALMYTFNFDSWDGIENYAKNFKPSYLYTVYPSILLAISFMTFNVGIHYFADDDKKIWSHYAMNFGLVYAIISISNYLIQLLTVMPSILEGSLGGLDILVSGYPNSIFYALMGSYFFMCISLFFTGLIFSKKYIRLFMFLSSIVCLVLFIIGALLSIAGIMIIGAICWMIGIIVGMVLISIYFYRLLKNTE